MSCERPQSLDEMRVHEWEVRTMQVYVPVCVSVCVCGGVGRRVFGHVQESGGGLARLTWREALTGKSKIGTT